MTAPGVDDTVDRTVAAVHRQDWGRLLSLLVARTRRLDLAEDALGEAFVRATDRWRSDGVPANPAGWLYSVAYRQIVGRLRAEAVAGRKAPLLVVGSEWSPPHESGHDGTDALGDERLDLILLCCHPALPREARSALALRLVIGTPTDQIARLFLVSTPTMAARITRAKKKIVTAGIPLGKPAREALDARLDEVCRTIYLAFTAGYAPGTGSDLVRADLAGEAVRLASILHELVPDAAQVRALLALSTLQHARRDARVEGGRLVTLADQDRSIWRHDEIRRGLALTERLQNESSFARELRLQALIAAEHARATTADETNWPEIVRCYEDLESLTGSPVVRLNRAVAVAEAVGPRAGLDLLVGLDDVLVGHRLPAVVAELSVRVGDLDTARASFATAIARCGNEVERRHLCGRLADIGAPS